MPVSENDGLLCGPCRIEDLEWESQEFDGTERQLAELRDAELFLKVTGWSMVAFAVGILISLLVAEWVKWLS